MAFVRSVTCIFCGVRVPATRHLHLPVSDDCVSVCEQHYELLGIALRNELVREVTSP